MSADTHATLRISSPSDLIAAVPYLIGFTPAESVVLVGLSGKRVVVTIRIDISDGESGLIKAMGLAVEPVSTQIIPRDRHAMYFATLGVVASSVERMIGPDATGTLDFALTRLASIVDKLVVYPANMQKNLDLLGGLVHSQRVMIALTQKGVAREDAYAIVQRNAMKVWQGEGDFLSLLTADKDVRKHLSEAELKANFDLDHHLRHVDTIFERVFGKTA